MKIFGIDLISKIEHELPPNFFQLVMNQFKTVDGLGKIIIILTLFFSFNFYAYIYISAGLMELENERLREDSLINKWSDLFPQRQDGYLPYCDVPFMNRNPQFTDFNESLSIKHEIGGLQSWYGNASAVTRFYTGISGLNELSFQRYAVEGAVVLESIAYLRDELTTPLFDLLNEKPNTSFFANVLYLLWLPLDLDAKNRLLEYKRKELGEIVLEILHQKAIYHNAKQFQRVFSEVFLTNNLKSRWFVTRNLQLMITNSKLRISLRK